MNELIREILISRINSGLSQAKLASKLNHPGLIGDLREIVLHNLIEPLLTSNYSTGTGKVIDYEGTLSTEIDICIYSRNIHPPFFFDRHDKFAVFPIESVLRCIEVKSFFNANALADTFEKFKKLDSALKFTTGFHDHNDYPLAHMFRKSGFDFFAFNIEAKKYTPAYILNIYKEIDPDWDTDPLITSICIVNKGWVCNTSNGWFHRSYDSKGKVNEEIIGYLSTLSQGLNLVEQSRGKPRIGYYLFDTSEMDKINNGKKIKNTWKNKKVKFSNTEI